MEENQELKEAAQETTDTRCETTECQKRRITELESETQRAAERETYTAKLEETTRRIKELEEMLRGKELDGQNTMDAHEAEVEAETKEV